MSVWNRLRQTLRPQSRPAAIDEELEFHIAMRAEALERQGLSKQEAEREARRKFGPRARIAEETRDAHLLIWLEALRRDSLYSLRALRRRPAFLLTGLATLALGIGVNVAIFSVADALLLRPIPAPAGDGLLGLVETRDGEPAGGNPRRMADYAAAMTSASHFAGFYADRLVTATPDGPQSLRALRTAGDLPAAFGFQPALGRLPGPRETNVALLGHRYWERQYGRARDVVGRVIATPSGPLEIVGVLGPDAALIEDFDLWVPMPADMLEVPRTAGFLMVVARLKPAASLAQANAELLTVNSALRAANPQTDKGLTARLAPLAEVLSAEAASPVKQLAAVVFTILLIACANLSGLLLARNAERSREAAIRSAIGAGRADLLRLFLLEAVWLALPGGLFGLLAAGWTLPLLKTLLPAGLPLLASVTIDLRAALFALTLSLFCALAIGLLPAWQVARLQTMARSPLRSGLVVAQIAGSLLLLIAASALLQNLLTARRVPLGFQSDRVLALQFDFPWDSNPDKLHRFYQDAEESLKQIPGVRAAGLVDRLPLEGGTQSRAYLRIHGQNLDETAARQSYGFRAVSNGYFRALRIPLLRGALPDPKQPEALVNAQFARRYFGDADPVGRQVSFSDANRAPVWYAIAGVVENVRVLATDLRAESEVYVPFERTFWPHSAMVVQVEGDPAAFTALARERLRRLDPFAAVRYAGPLESRLDAAFDEPKTMSLLLTGLALCALLLVAVGLYGMLAGFVRARTREFGIRLALGAAPSSLVLLSIRHGMRLIALGLLIGLAASAPVLRAPDPRAAAAAAALLLLAALAACLPPALRAARLDPVIVLRHD